MNHPRVIIAGLAVLMGALGCTGSDPDSESPDEAREVVLGPVDGHGLPGTDLERVSAGDLAPDFTAMSLEGEPITLSQYRGKRHVVLVFYRGHW